MGRRIDTSIDIGAPRERVWAVLLDFAAYPQWNPFIKKISGRVLVGETLEALIEPPGRAAQTFRPTVIRVDPEFGFAWQGSLPIPGLFTGEHVFALSNIAGGTRFDHSESFSGLLVPMLGGVLRDSEIGFRAMNEALRQRAQV